MLDVIEQTTELPLDNAGKRARIESELCNDPQRSDREIARIVGCDHKTVGSVRAKTSPLASPTIEETPTNRRHMLINAAADFMRLNPDQDDGATPEQAVDDAIAKGIVSLAPGRCPPPPGVVDEPEFDPFSSDSEDLVIPHQPAIAVYENTAGAVVIRQHRDDDDVVILVRPENVEVLVKRLRQVAEEAQR